MSELSRMKKYEDLRNKLQEVDESVSTKELSRFEKRLNELDSNNFSMSNRVLNDDHSAVHARNNTSSIDLSRKNYENTSAINNTNSIYDEYINEVKQYNLEQGNAVSTNTSVNVLNQIREEIKKPNNQKPYLSNYQKKENTNPTFENDLPFLNNNRKNIDLINTEKIAVVEEEHPFEDSQTMSKDDIMAEVQSLVNGNLKESNSPMGTDTFQRHISADRTAQQQLLNETTQMRAQLDDYEDNLSEVNGKVHEVLRLSNIILTVFIFFLVVALICFIYLVILSRGV